MELKSQTRLNVYSLARWVRTWVAEWNVVNEDVRRSQSRIRSPRESEAHLMNWSCSRICSWSSHCAKRTPTRSRLNRSAISIPAGRKPYSCFSGSLGWYQYHHNNEGACFSVKILDLSATSLRDSLFRLQVCDRLKVVAGINETATRISRVSTSFQTQVDRSISVADEQDALARLMTHSECRRIPLAQFSNAMPVVVDVLPSQVLLNVMIVRKLIAIVPETHQTIIASSPLPTSRRFAAQTNLATLSEPWSSFRQVQLSLPHSPHLALPPLRPFPNKLGVDNHVNNAGWQNYHEGGSGEAIGGKSWRNLDECL